MKIENIYCSGTAKCSHVYCEHKYLAYALCRNFSSWRTCVKGNTTKMEKPIRSLCIPF